MILGISTLSADCSLTIASGCVQAARGVLLRTAEALDRIDWLQGPPPVTMANIYCSRRVSMRVCVCLCAHTLLLDHSEATDDNVSIIIIRCLHVLRCLHAMRSFHVMT